MIFSGGVWPQEFDKLLLLILVKYQTPDSANIMVSQNKVLDGFAVALFQRRIILMCSVTMLLNPPASVCFKD